MGSFSIWHWLIFAAIVYFVARALGFAKKTPKAAEGGLIPKVRGNGSFSFEVVGESHYQAAFSAIYGSKTEDGLDEIAVAQLVLEDDNKHDNKAVRVEIENRTVGYLPRGVAREFRKAVGDNSSAKGYQAFLVDARVKGGWDRGGGDTGHYGVWLDLPEP